jgi:carbonic anhydrase
MLCPHCAQHPVFPRLGRRQILRLGAGAMLTAAAGAAKAASNEAPPKPGNVFSPDAALTSLMQGNARYVAGLTRRHDFKSERDILAQGQNPFAAILGCADSRVGPEFAFDAFRGDLFVTRVAGNFANDDIVASLEYAVAELHTPLIMVLGHSGCGAVAATIKSLDQNITLPGHLPSLVTSLTPAVEAAKGEAGDLLTNAIKDNVRLNVSRLRTASPILSAAVQSQVLRVVGGYYELASGEVELIDA